MNSDTNESLGKPLICIEPTPMELEEPSVRVGRLDTISDVRGELARLYRAARRAAGPAPDAQSAARLAYLLTCIGRSLEASEIEKRISKVESLMEDQNEQNF